MHHHAQHVKQNQDKALVNFKKAKSQIDNIIRMIEDDTYCVDVMHQNMAVIGMLKSAHQLMMEDHLHTCFSDAMDSHDDAHKAEMVDEILKVTKLVQK